MLPPISFEFIFGATWFVIMAAFYGPRSTELRGMSLLTMPIGSFLMAFQLWGTVYTLMWLVATGLDIHLVLSPFWLSMGWFLLLTYATFFVSWAIGRLVEPKR